MSEIWLHRGYSLGLERWVYGTPTFRSERDVHGNMKNFLAIAEDENRKIVIADGSLGRFSGLADSRGRGIYEGDILEKGRVVNGNVVHETAGVVDFDGSFFVGSKSLTDLLTETVAKDGHYLIVVGNAFQMPFLPKCDKEEAPIEDCEN